MSSKSYNELINKLDAFIRKYYVNQIIRGSLYFTGLTILLFLVFSLAEYYLYFDTTVRKLMFYGFLSASLGTFYIWILNPLLHYFRLGQLISHEQAAVIIGNHFPEVKDKLLNILQLRNQAENSAQNELLLAGIDQKSAAIQFVPFTKAIDYGTNKKHLKYTLPPLLLLLVILLASPTLITDSTNRIIRNNEIFEKEAPFSFIIENESLQVPQNEDFKLVVDLEGKALPKEAFLVMNDFQYRLQKGDDHKFSYTFKNVQRNTPFKLYAAGFYSTPYELEIIRKPNITGFEIKLNYPSYTGLKSETITNAGDLSVPVGTRIDWNFESNHTEQIQFRFDIENELISADKSRQRFFSFQKRAMASGSYTILLSNDEIPDPDSFSYSIQVIPDQYPNISVEQFTDNNSTEKLYYFAGDASDDYGIRTIEFIYDIINNKGDIRKKDTLVVHKGGNKKTDFSHVWDMSKLEIGPGERINYFFEVADNDAVNGSKRSRTQIFSFAKPTEKEFEELAQKNNEDIKENLSKSIQEMKKIQEEIKEIREKLLQEKDMTWQRKKELERLLDRKKELEKAILESQQKFQENKQNQQEFQQPDEQIQDKQEKLDNLFDNLVDPEKQELLDKIRELMQELRKEDALKMMDDMNSQSRQQEMEMDRLLELFKTLEVENDMKKLADDLMKLADEQDALREETGKKYSEGKDLKEKQNELNKKMEDLQKKMDQLEEKNKELQRPKDLGESGDSMDDAKQDMDKASEELNKEQKNNAQKKQKSASEKMREAGSKMQGAMNSGEMAQMEEDMKSLRQLLENIITLSFEQEELINEFGKVNTTAPAYVRLVREQNRIRENFRLVEDSLHALSKRVFQLEGFIMDKTAEINNNIGQSLEHLEERRKPQASENQQRTMKNLNDLALMLSETMEQMQNAMAQMTPGTQMCQNPGQGEGEGKQPMDKITEGQEKVSEEMKQMKEQMGKGEQPGSKEFAEIAAQQAKIRKMLEQLQKEKQQQGKGDPLLQDILNDMNKNEIDLVNKRLTNETLRRQKDIITRLLEAEKASREQDWDEKRKADRPDNIAKTIPPSMEEYIKKRKAESEMFKSVPASLTPFYKQLAENYYNTLKD